MKDRKVGIMTLALTLIGLGVILTYNNFITLDMTKTLRILAAVSIIVLGVEFIVMEWSNRKSEDKVRLKMSGLCIFTLIIIYAASSIIPLGIVINNEKITFHGWSLFNNFNQHQYTFERSYEEDVEDLTKFVVRNNYGDIEIVPTETTKVTVNATIQVGLNEEDETKAETIADETINIKSLGDILEVSATRYQNNTSISIDYTISVPSYLITAINNGNGDVQIKGVKEVAVDNRYGDVVIRDIAGKVSLENQNGHITVNNIGDSLAVQNSYGNITAVTIDGDTKIENKNGDVEVEGVSGDLDIENRYDDIRFSQITGNVVIDQQNGEVKGDQVGKSVEVSTKYSSVSLEDVKGDIDIETQNEDVTITDIGGNVVVTNQSGKVIGKNLGKDVSVKNKYAMVKLEDVKGKVDVETQNDLIELKNIESDIKVIQRSGNITVENVSGDVDIESKYGNINILNRNTFLKNVDIINESGDVSLDTPDDQEGKFVFYSKYGKIKTDKGLSIKEDNSEITVKETLGSGSNTISVQVKSGDITLE